MSLNMHKVYCFNCPIHLRCSSNASFNEPFEPSISSRPAYLHAMIPVQPLPILPPRKPALASPAPVGGPVLRLGFRPFYVGAALFAAMAVPVGVARDLGDWQLRLSVPPW